MPVLQLGHWIDAKRRERAYKRQDKKSALGAKPTQANADELQLPERPLSSDADARRA